MGQATLKPGTTTVPNISIGHPAILTNCAGLQAAQDMCDVFSVEGFPLPHNALRTIYLRVVMWLQVPVMLFDSTDR